MGRAGIEAVSAAMNDTAVVATFDVDGVGDAAAVDALATGT